MRLYKLTDENCETYNHTKWGDGITHTTSGKGDLCGPGWIHAYTSPELAVLLNPIHANFKDPILWEADGGAGAAKYDNGLKVGVTQLTTVKRIPLPRVTKEIRVRFAILCALEVCKDADFVRWAKNWLNGADRSWSSAEAAARAAARAAWAAAWAVEAAELDVIALAKAAFDKSKKY